MPRALKMYWWTSRKNFGDLLGPDIVSNITGRPVIRAEVGDCELISLGSVLSFILRSEELVKEPLHVWGTGFIWSNVPIVNPHVQFHAVRGKWTAYIQDLPDPVLGDPGLLVSRFQPAPAKTHRIGVVPHHSQFDDGSLMKFFERDDVLCINAHNDPWQVVREIASCEFILSSSLHGLIVADSYGIPNQWVEPNAEDIHSTFKFYDYYSALELPPSFRQGPVLMNQSPEVEPLLRRLSKNYARYNVEDLGDKLVAAFPEQLLG